MRVALDTNVLASAYTTRGLSADVYRHVLARHELVLSQPVIAEFGRVLSKRLGVPRRYVASLIEELLLHEVVAVAKPDASPGIIRDPDDRRVVAAAIKGLCEILVTGDLDILDVRDRIPGIRVVTPREYWESVRSSL